MPALEKGQSGPLNVTLKARRRIMAGLGWDPAEEPGFVDKVQALAGKKDIHHDLDLACYIFDAGLEYLGRVSAEPGFAVDSAEMIYHSGDNEEGYGDGDDEEISAELVDLPADIDRLVFTAIIRTKHSFKDIDTAEIRLADGYTNHNFLSLPINHKDGHRKNAFIFAEVFRDSEAESGWGLHHISDYAHYTGADGFPETLKRFLHLRAG